MKIADKIRKLGFRKWYERQLIASHAHLVTCFLCLILVAAAFEELDLRGPMGPAILQLSLMLAGVSLCIFSFRRYQGMLLFAERLAGHATCPKCEKYASIKVISSGPRVVEDEEENLAVMAETWLRVKCKCGNEWTI